jgi:nucleoside-diphosphate-sugar epimerase
MSVRIAIIGANGFIGSRAVEMLHLGAAAEVRPVVRTAHGAARLFRFDLDCRIANACHEVSLRTALEGCDAVVHAVAGTPDVVLESIAPVYRAAEHAGVRRLVYLSSASVHGQAPAPGTDESGPLSDRQPIAYNNAKVRAERQLLRLRENGAVEVVILRPGIVTGPRSGWISQFASNLLAGTAYWLNDGKGICNSIYVDNLVHAIQLALTTPAADGHAFIVGDEETVTWADLYRPVVAALGFDVTDLPSATVIKQGRSQREALDALKSRAVVRSTLALIPKRLRRALRAVLSAPPQAVASPWTHDACGATQTHTIAATLEMALLYGCAAKLPDTKARRILGYRPIVTFAEGCRRTLGWLEFAGYPLVADYLNRADSAMSGYSSR